MRQFLIVAAAILFFAGQAFGKPTGVPLNLEQMARQKFTSPPLSAAEERIVQHAPDGSLADCRDLGGGSDPAKADGWPASRNVRADLIRWLLVDREARKQVDPRGVWILGGRITRALDLSFTNVPFPLGMFGCRLDQPLILMWTKMPALNLNGSWTMEINADGLELEGGLFLSNGFHAEHGVRLLGASIGSVLQAMGGTFKDPNGVAFNADGLKVGRSVFLNGKFVADGTVRLLGASIGGDLNAEGGTFKNPNGYALNADRVDVRGNISLGNGFNAEGQVRLPAASIGGDLDAEGGTFKNPNRVALVADSIKVHGKVLLRDRFVADGTVGLPGAEITGQLEVIDAWLDALVLESAHVAGRFFWQNIHNDPNPDFPKKEWKPSLDLTNAKVGSLVDQEASWPEKGRLFLDGFVYDGIGGNAPTDTKRQLDWLHLQPEEDGYLPQPYEQLIAVFRRLGHEDRVAEVAIAKQLDLREHGRLGWWGKFWNRVLYLVIGYGYEPWRAFLWMAALVILGALMFLLARLRSVGVMVPSEKDAYKPDEKTEKAPLPHYYPKFNALVYSLDVIFPFDLGQKSHWRLSEKQSGALVYWIFEVYSLVQLFVGWVLLLIAAAVPAGFIK